MIINSIGNKGIKKYIFLGEMFLLLSFLLIFPNHTQAQELEPQKVVALSDDMCGGKPNPITLEVWNVGSAGGDAYSQAVITGYDCVNGEIADTPKILMGTFSGGPNGIVTMDYGASCQFINGKTVQCGEGGAVFIVQNPEAFETATPPPSDCRATISLPPNLKIGDDLWVRATYVDLKGGAVAPETIISEAWITNGNLGAPTGTWDGRAMKIELQYTCPNGNAHTQIYDLPQYQETLQKPAATPETPPTAVITPPNNKATTNPSWLIPVIIAGVLAIGAVTLVAGGVITYVVVNKKGIIGKKPSMPVQPRPITPSLVQTPPTRHAPSSSQPASLPPTQPPPHFEQPKPPTSEEIEKMKNLRAEMETAIEEYKSEWQDISKKLHHLQQIQKKNLIKRVLQLGIETHDIISLNNPTAIATKILSLPVEEAIGKPSPEDETKILLAMDTLIRNMKGRMEFLQNEVRTLRSEIHKIDETLNQ